MQSCRACGSNLAKLLFIIGDNRVVRCSDCSHVFLDIVHDAQSIQLMYESYEAGMDFYFEGPDDEVIQNIDTYLKRSTDYCQASANGCRLLDIGCGAGILLGRAKALGLIPEGVEISEQLAHTAEKKVGTTIYRAFLGNLELPPETFDIVTMYDLIEHLQDPAAELKLVYRLLRPGGILFVLTPNNDALMRRIARWACTVSFHRFSRPLQVLYYNKHLSYFTGHSLNILLNRAGFQVVRSETRNQEVSRLALTNLERLAVRTIFLASKPFGSLGGKLVVWARKPAGQNA
jgi:2-polyprenyl-3-methyl-5-hydroxy-6-metoxy-1,4-benzoquinol methylase